MNINIDRDPFPRPSKHWVLQTHERARQARARWAIACRISVVGPQTFMMLRYQGVSIYWPPDLAQAASTILPDDAALCWAARHHPWILAGDRGRRLLLSTFSDAACGRHQLSSLAFSFSNLPATGPSWAT